MSECYLIHLFAPVNPDRPARHYLGFAANTVERVANYRKHRAYFHSRLMFAAVERQIDFVVARVWKQCDKRDERRLRDLHNNPRLCPICNPSLQLETRLNTAGRYQTYATADPKRLRYGDLRQLRDRHIRPARPRVRSDGSSNGVERTPKLVIPDVSFAPYGFDSDIPY